MPSLNRVQVLRYHLQVPLRQAGSDATINDKSNSRMQNNPLIDMSASGSKTWWTVNELYLSYGGIMFLVGVTVARFVYYMQSRRNSTTKNRTVRYSKKNDVVAFIKHIRPIASTISRSSLSNLVTI